MPSSYADLVGNLDRTAASDECYTPSKQVYPLLQFLGDREETIWYEATSDRSGAIIKAFRDKGYRIEGNQGRDFFSCGPDDVYGGVITNPPYSKKDDFIEHCYRLGCPWALLLPVSALQGRRRGSLFMKYGCGLIVNNRRIDFTGNKAPPFGTAWFTYNIPGVANNTVRWIDNNEEDEDELPEGLSLL